MDEGASSGMPVILVVDDDPRNLAVVRDCLIECGYTILVAEDGECAVERAAYAQPDLILLDIMMPELDGYETCCRLKAQESTRDIPVVFMSALAETSHLVKGMEAGGVDYVTKPFQREELLARIRVHLRIRELTNQLRVANENLEQRVVERTEELVRTNVILQEEIDERIRREKEQRKLERELRHAQKMEAIGTLSAGIAHDFNNILTAIIGFTEMAQWDVPKDQPAYSHLQRVLESSCRASDLVRQILAYSRQNEIVRKPVLLARIIDEILPLVRSALPSTVEICQNYELSGEEGIVLADSTQLHQLLMNLCTNAVQAMGTRGGTLTLHIASVDGDEKLFSRFPGLQPGPYLKLMVSDTGHGMEPSIIERIFDPYFTTKPVGEGTGMGLAVSMGIVQSHGGDIAVTSQPGVGTAFTVYLPKFHGDLVSELRESRQLPTGKERILFVDDEESLAFMAQEMLEILGYSVTSLTNSVEALDLFRSQPKDFDLIITDATMPELPGLELAGQMMAIRDDIPVIICSGLSEWDNGSGGYPAVIRDMLVKPYSTSSLASMIRRVLD